MGAKSSKPTEIHRLDELGVGVHVAAHEYSAYKYFGKCWEPMVPPEQSMPWSFKRCIGLVAIPRGATIVVPEEAGRSSADVRVSAMRLETIWPMEQPHEYCQAGESPIFPTTYRCDVMARTPVSKDTRRVDAQGIHVYTSQAVLERMWPPQAEPDHRTDSCREHAIWF